ncbi:MAG: two-component system, OmpR family, sensor kinase [Solirubrobacterales bacterium]|jgi:signal transduction histidine kinase|nr:two-component system, OmpR family, sensor kinase [Solirubrobacterales bacterium]
MAVPGPAASRPRFLTPSRWPVRWRLAGVSASLTFVILLAFAAVVGKLSQERLENDFQNELQAAANRIAFTIQVDVETGNVDVPFDELIGDEVVRVTPAIGDPVGDVDVRLPSPSAEIVSFGDLDVATAQVRTPLVGAGVTFVQVARDHDELDATISRLWFFLAVGVAGGSILATLAGLAVAGRAMGPIAALTTTAREIATTRDPARTMPKPEAEDEVAELATTLDEMLRELDAARNEAQGMVHAQREFVADASHELRTPLTSILANLELLQAALERNPTEGEEAEMVESALRSSRRMRRLVGDLLILARADAGRQGARRPCDLAAITEAAAAEVRPVASEHTIDLALEPTSVEGNPDELHRVVLNLIDNGVRHTPPGSTITVRVFQRDSQAVLEVADDGPGIPESIEGQVFGRFVRGSGPADVTADSGAGLGLSIVRAVATAHGGSVTVGPSNHGGALFTVTLPILSEAPVDVPKKLSRIL